MNRVFLFVHYIIFINECSSICFVITLLNILKMGRENMENNSTVRLLEAHSRMKHDIMNYLQVISGYLQIGAPQKAQEYINQVVNSIKKYDALSKLGLTRLRANLLWYISQGDLEHDGFSISMTGEFEEWKVFDDELTNVIMGILEPIQKEIVSGIIKCHMHFYQDEDIGIEIRLSGEVDNKIVSTIKKAIISSDDTEFDCEYKMQDGICINVKRC